MWTLHADRMLVLAALERLATGDWGDSTDARLVVDTFCDLPTFDPPKTAIAVSRRGTPEHVEGLTELGTVSVDTSQDGWRTTSVGTAPEHRRCHIGRFIVTRAARDPIGVIVWRDFRALQPMLVDQPPLPLFRLRYLLEYRIPYHLGRLDAGPGTPPLWDRLVSFVLRCRYGRYFASSCWRYEETVLYRTPGIDS